MRQQTDPHPGGHRGDGTAYLRHALVALLLAFALLSTLGAGAARAEAQPTGRTVKAVFLMNQSGVLLGSYRSQGNGTWLILDKAGKKQGKLREISRDNNSVYLSEDQSGAYVLLDLPQRMMFYAEGGQKLQPLFTIAWAEADPPTGHTLTLVEYVSSDGKSFGSFRSQDGGKWAESDGKGQERFYFVEMGREKTAVHLLDRSRGLEVHIDLKGDVITWNYVGKQRLTAYRIVTEQ